MPALNGMNTARICDKFNGPRVGPGHVITVDIP